jgi:hypothetical protein
MFPRLPRHYVAVYRYRALIQSGTTSDVQSLPNLKLAESGLLWLRMQVPENVVKYVHEGDEMQIRVDQIGTTPGYNPRSATLSAIVF